MFFFSLFVFVVVDLTCQLRSPWQRPPYSATSRSPSLSCPLPWLDAPLASRRQLDFYDVTSAKMLSFPQISILLSSLTEPAHPHLAKSSYADDSDPLPATHCAPVLQRGEPNKYRHYTIDNKCSADLYKCTLHCDSSAENWSCSLQGVASWHLRDHR